MALSMDEQRVLAEIERRLAADDPRLAACMTSFRRPGPAAALRSPRARIIGSLFTVLLVAMISLMVYAMIPFRAHGARTPDGQAVTPGQAQLSATGSPHQLTMSTYPGATKAKTGAKASASATAGTAAVAKTAAGTSATAGRDQVAKPKTTNRSGSTAPSG
jgi:Protein of unknown function (DUF3040)